MVHPCRSMYLILKSRIFSMNPNPLIFAEVKGKDCWVKGSHIFNLFYVAKLSRKCSHNLFSHQQVLSFQTLLLHHSNTGRIPKGLGGCKCMLKSLSFLPICPFKNNSERFHRKLVISSGSTSGHSESREILKTPGFGDLVLFIKQFPLL